MSDAHLAPETLSAWIDGDLELHEKDEADRHLVACARCARTLAELRAIVAAAGELDVRQPERDLWPALERRLASRRPQPWMAAVAGLAAGLLLAWGFGLLRSDSPDDALSGAAGERFLLVLHEAPETFADLGPDEAAAIVARYRDWAQELAREGRLEAGEKLADGEGRWLRRAEGETEVEPRDERGGLAGFFVIRAADYDEAAALSRTCPHLELGGWIELRRIDET